MFGRAPEDGWRAKFRSFLGRFQGHGPAREELEPLLYEADLPREWVEKLLSVTKARHPATKEELLALLRAEGIRALSETETPPKELPIPGAILLLGVNGVGKTTVAAKLAARLSGQGRRVVLAAADTFRAGAVEQLEEWGRRLSVEVVTRKGGADPAAVVFDAWQRAVAQEAVLIADTAGRLHTQAPLMSQIAKVVRVLGRDGRGAPHESYLVLDATLGQNSIAQAREFQESAPLTGLILNKVDGSARGGAALSAAAEFRLPIRYLGIGESAEDLVPFEAERFVAELFRE